MDDTYIFPPSRVEDEKMLIANVINNQLSSDDTSVSSAAAAAEADVLWDEDSNNDEDINVMDEDESIIDSDSEDEEDLSDDEYPYYESEDDGGVLNEETLHKIKDNNPEVTNLVVRRFSTAVPAKDAGIYVGQNTNLKKLTIKGGDNTWEGNPAQVQESHQIFSQGVANNRSIELLSIQECSLDSGSSDVSTLPSFIQNNDNLHTLEIVGCDIGHTKAHLLAASFLKRSKTSFLKISLDANRISDMVGQELVDSLLGHTNLECLSLGDNEINIQTCSALSKLLTSTNTKLAEINLENNHINDEATSILTNALNKNKVLKKLNLSFNCDITQQGWQIFSTCMQQGGSIIETLNISSTNISNQGISALGSSLIGNTTLKTLDLYDINNNGTPLINSVGWSSFFACIQSPSSALQQVDLRYSSIDEGGLLVLADALTKSSKVRMLDVSQNLHISVEIWKSFFSRLGNAFFSLEELYAQGNNITDEAVAEISHALVGNNTLKTVSLGDLFPIGKTGWEFVRHLLCNQSSISNLHKSNHTLQSFGCDIPEDVQQLLNTNKTVNKKEVAREKILKYGADNIIETVVGLELNVLPSAVSYIGEDERGLSMLYQLCKSLPTLFESKHKLNYAGVKRKRPCKCT